jgi:outer membrane protein assembly factor BamB/tRNA A-37 threonylcarbamoyl transferase component Bud32
LETHNITQNFDDSSLEPGRDHQLSAGVSLQERYLIQGMLGIGGMSAVYRARDLHFPNVVKLVAVKEMVNRAIDPIVRTTIVRNFEREANLLASLDHRAIPRIYDYFSINDRSYLVLEYIHGHDMEMVINNSPDFLPEERVVRWAVELCDVLSYLHTHKPDTIVFRDMKPSNVMINQQDHVVLVDFGIAKPFESGQKGTMIGTEGYSPPEQYRGEATPLADIYALGATLHHALTRHDPRLEAPFSFNERPIRQMNSNISPELEAVVTTALQYDPGDRYQSANAMKEALLGAAKETGILRQVSTNLGPQKSEEDVKPIWAFQCEDEIRGSPMVYSDKVYIGCYDSNLYALDAKNGTFLWKYPSEGGVVSRPAIFEDNLFFGSEDYRLHAIFQRNGRLNWTYFTNGPIRSSPFVAEGHIFIGSDDGFLHAVNATTGRMAWRIDAGSPVRCTPMVYQEHIYFGSEQGDFHCADFRGSIRWRFKAKRAITSSPVVAKNVVYFGSVDSTVYALDTNTGWVIWKFRLNKPSISTPCIADNLLFTGAVDGTIYCLDSGSAKEVWRFTTQHQVTGSPIIYNDSLYCGSVDGYFYCLEYHTGRVRWKFQTNGPITGTPAAQDGIIYIGSTDHHLYALLA